MTFYNGTVKLVSKQSPFQVDDLITNKSVVILETFRRIMHSPCQHSCLRKKKKKKKKKKT
jgi:hypothetical protein